MQTLYYQLSYIVHLHIYVYLTLKRLLALAPTIHATQVFPTLYSSVRIHAPLNALKTETLKKVMYKLEMVCIPKKKEETMTLLNIFFFLLKFI